MFLPFASFSDSRPSAGKLTELERPPLLGILERCAEKALRAKMKHLIAECNGLYGRWPRCRGGELSTTIESGCPRACPEPVEGCLAFGHVGLSQSRAHLQRITLAKRRIAACQICTQSISASANPTCQACARSEALYPPPPVPAFYENKQLNGVIIPSVQGGLSY
jgi:hypothetical protein